MDSDSNGVWRNYFASSGHQIQTLVSGFLFVLAALCLVVFVSSMWSRIAEGRRPESTSPIPLVASGMGAAGIALGGVLVAAVSGGMIFGQLQLPPADILRFGNDAAFPAITVAGMFGVALAIASLAVQARSAGLFGRRFQIVGLVVAVVTIFSFGFFPLVAPLLWFLVVSIMLLRKEPSVGAPATVAPDLVAARAPTSSPEQS
jgi:L-lactate permease